MTPEEPRASHNSRDIAKARRTIGLLPEPWPRPVLVMLSGLPGAGKSYFARRLAGRIPMAVVSTDAVRLALVRRPKYTWQESRRVYDVCHVLLDDLLSGGIPIIFDATNLLERFRRAVYEIAERHNARLVIVETISPEDVVWERMERRAAGEDRLDKSEADWDVYLKMKESADPIERDHFTVDTSRDLEPALERVEEAIRTH